MCVVDFARADLHSNFIHVMLIYQTPMYIINKIISIIMYVYNLASPHGESWKYCFSYIHVCVFVRVYVHDIFRIIMIMAQKNIYICECECSFYLKTVKAIYIYLLLRYCDLCPCH